MNVLAIYGSNTGNTKNLMYFVKEYFKKQIKCNFNLINTKDNIYIENFKQYDLVILSSPTWGGIAPTLQDDFANFWGKINKKIISGNKFAIIGLGDLYYQSFCKAVDFLTDDIIKYQGKLLINSLSIPDDWDTHKPFIEEWLNKMINILKAISV